MTAGRESPRGPEPASAIEVDFPVRAVNRLAALEAYNKHHYRPANYQHKWWAKRLGSVFRTLTIAALDPPTVSADAVWDQVTDPPRFDDCVVYDPFMGGGTTGQEATRLGARFVGADLNPVAWFVACMGLAPPPADLDGAVEQVLEGARDQIEPYFRTTCPTCGDPAGAQFYLWVRLLDADDPSDRAHEAEPPTAAVRAYDSLVVDHDRDGGATVVCPRCHQLSAVDDPEAAVCADCGDRFDATAEDVHVPVDEPQAVFNGGERPAYEPYAVKYDCDACDESGFDAFDAFDAERLATARERFAAVRDDLPLPEQAIPSGGEKTRDLHNRHYDRWTQLFTDRQLLALGTLLDRVTAVEDDLARHYLTLAFSATLEFNSMFCSYKGADPRGPGAVRHLFSHHAYVHPGEPLENNPIGTRARQSGTFRYLCEYRLRKALAFKARPVERVLGDDGAVSEKRPMDGERIGGQPAASVDDLLGGEATHLLHCGDSADLPFADALAGRVDAVVTDPPYYDSVQYGELADCFYVWLKQSLEPDFPDTFAADSVVSAAEAVGNATRGKSLDEYRRLLQDVFESSHRLLRDDGPLVFTFHHRDPAAWGAVLEAVDGAGFTVVATYPVRGEHRLSVHINGQRAVLLDSVVVCRKAGERPDGDWDAVRDAVERETRDRLDAYHRGDGDEDLSRLDASVVAYGACMNAFSSYGAVTDADGTAVAARDAMERIQPVIDALNDDSF